LGRVIALALLLAVPVPPEAVRAPPASVYRVSPAIDAPIIGATLLAIAIPYAFAGTFIHPRCPCDPNAVNALDRHVIGNHNKFLDDASDVTAGIVMVGPLLLDWLDVGLSRTLLEDATVYGETLAVNGALVTATKYIVQRPLPRTYAGDPALLNQPGGYRSFYSGHTSLVVAALSATAVTLEARHGQRVWPWLMVAAIGGMVAAERIAAGRHFYTDVAVGAVAGAAVGTLVPIAHRPANRGDGPLTFRF
jgi:membrane-associated phospholipid phosphatase